MTLFDHIFLVLLALSALLGLWRGLVGEVFALLGWIFALATAWYCAPLGVPMLAGAVETEWARWPLVFLAVFVTVLLLLALLRFLLRELLSVAGLGVLDRMAGAGFGVLRALVLALLLVAAAGMSSLPKEQWWRGSTFAPPLEVAVLAVKPWLPRDLADRIKY
ncbi:MULTISPECIES: CvpA family protein [unclassified Uliginosibacterium]|uniref:CvpA family protein n=1 Tax=unclassified Uliginosibacterium TaxID=2621521 RepID=UPI000C7ADA1F|nr:MULTISPECIES: CvpA family protein [unclassified Uliginosibacterium]MDO6385145.1 CvpA family protein [Uliginosibacterium sp. 31-12]PLK48821.1 colicin V production protein [Uliginosibacterium sp. TH139]